jgi:hypothetical protein
MNSLPQSRSPIRSPRAHLACAAPAVLRFENGQRTSGKLQVLSLTGGLLSLPNPITQGSQVKLMFLTHAGTVLGGAEMLSPLNDRSQAFRFTSLAFDDQRRLGATIQATLQPTNSEAQWIEKLRAASVSENARTGRLFKALIAAVTFAAFTLAGAMYLLHWQIWK